MTTQPSPKDGLSEPSVLADKSPGVGFFKKLKIGPKLTVGFGILVVLTFLGAAVSYLGSNQATTKINRTTDVRAPTALEASRAQANLLRMQADVRAYLALGDPEYRESYAASAQDFEADLSRLEERKLDLDVENQRRLIRLRVACDRWAELPEQLFELRDDQLDREPAYRLLATEGIRYAGQVLIATNTMIETQGQRESSVQNLAVLEDMAKFQGNFAAMLSALRGYVTTRNRIYRGEYEVNLVDNQNAWEQLSGKRSALTDNQQELFDKIAQNREAFLALPEQIFEDLEGDRWREDLYLFRTEAVPLAEEMQQLLNEMTEEQQAFLQTDLAAGRSDLSNTNTIILVSGILALLIGVSMAYITREAIAGPVVRLTGVAERIQGGDLEAQAKVESGDEIGVLAKTFNKMTAQLQRTLLQVRKEKKRADDLLEVVIPIGVELASEKDFNRLLEKMLLEAKTFCHADAGILYLKEEERLKFVIVRNDTLNIAMGGTVDEDVTFSRLPDLPPRYDDEATREGNRQNMAAYVARTGATINIRDAYQEQVFNTYGPGVFDEKTGYCSISCLTIPLKDSQGQVLGVLQLINAKDPETSEVIPFDSNLQRMMESFSSLAVAALEAYVREQSLRRQIQQLRIEIDEVKRQKQVSEIVDTDFFQDLRAKARSMRQRHSKGGDLAEEES